MIEYENYDNNNDDYGVDITLQTVDKPHRSAVLAKSVRFVRQPIINIVYVRAYVFGSFTFTVQRNNNSKAHTLHTAFVPSAAIFNGFIVIFHICISYFPACICTKHTYTHDEQWCELSPWPLHQYVLASKFLRPQISVFVAHHTHPQSLPPKLVLIILDRIHLAKSHIRITVDLWCPKA